MAELCYGGGTVTRTLIYFDEDKIRRLVEDKTCPDISKFKHVLKITNARFIGLYPNTLQ